MPTSSRSSAITEENIKSPLLSGAKPKYNDGMTYKTLTPEPTIKIYKRRWGILALFCLFSMSNGYQWIHLNIIADVLLVYYNQSLPVLPENKSLAVDWLSTVFMVAYIVLIIPTTWVIDRLGLRWVAILATFFNCLGALGDLFKASLIKYLVKTGAWIKCASIDPTRFWLLKSAQVVCAIAQMFIYGIPALLAAVWFSPDQVSTATSIGVFSNVFGFGVGFLIPPMIVQLHPKMPQSNVTFPLTSTTSMVQQSTRKTFKDMIDATSSSSNLIYDLSATASSLQYLFYGGAVYMTVLFLIVVFVYQKRPPYPASIAQYKITQNTAETSYTASLHRLIKNRPFMLLVLTYGIIIGLFFAVSTLLNPIIFRNFNKDEYPHINKDAGRIGLTIVISGMFGSFVFGLWLDRTKSFKLTSVITYCLSFVGMLTFTFSFYLRQVWIIYVTAGCLGFAMNGFFVVGIEFAMELTYPEPEGTSAGLICTSSQAFGLVLILIMGWLGRLEGNPQDNIRNANLTGCGVLLIGGVLIACVKNDLKRLKAEETEVEISGDET